MNSDDVEPEEDLRKKNKELVLNAYKEGKVVFMTFDGAMAAPLEEFIKQPTDGLLYDLNRDEVTVLSWIDDPKWVNDFAVAKVIRRLKERVDELIAHSIKLEYTLMVARMGIEQGSTMDTRTAANGPTIREVIENAMKKLRQQYT